jgi:hypothetical protein
VSVTVAPAFYCPIEHAHRRLDVVEEVCAGKFTHHGLSLDLGLPPDWRSSALPPDDEWRIEWWKHYEGLDLAHAFHATGERRFADAWESLVASFVEQVPVGSDTSDVAARRLTNWIYAWTSFGDAVDVALADRIAAEVAFVRDHLTPERNHRTLELYALFLASLAFPDAELLAFATAELERNLRDDFRPDGVHREASTHYHMVALRSFVAALEDGRRFGVRFSADFVRRLERAYEFACHVRRPDGSIPALSDSDNGDYTALLELAGALLGRSEPRACSASFPDGGYYVQRSGWDSDARFLIFDCGPLGDGGHGHYDLLSVEIATGCPLVVDPGRGTYSEAGPNLRRWFKRTSAHNTVLVDGLDQTPYRRGKPKGEVATGRLLARFTRPGLDLLTGEARSPVYEAVHERRVLFVGGEYWLIEDLLRGERPHGYELRFHLAPGTATADGPVVRAPGLTLVLADGLEACLEPGLVAPSYGELVDAPVVVARAGGIEARFLTLVFPGDEVPSLRERDGAVEVATTGFRDALAWTTDRALWTREAP